jgi:hypothetical protein
VTAAIDALLPDLLATLSNAFLIEFGSKIKFDHVAGIFLAGFIKD